MVKVSCADLLRELSNYLDGEVSPKLRLALEEHIQGCNCCWALVDSTRKTLRILADEKIIEIPAGFSERLWAALDRRLAGR